MSKGSQALYGQLLEMFGGARIEPEYCVGESLRLDFYLPDHKLGFEWHGRQHKEFVEHFHGSIAGFKDAQRRDRRKLELCAELGIAVVVFWDDEIVDQTVLGARIMAAFAEANALKKAVVQPTKDWKKIASDNRKAQHEQQKNSESHKEKLEKAREARKERYQWMKEAKSRQSKSIS